MFDTIEGTIEVESAMCGSAPGWTIRQVRKFTESGEWEADKRVLFEVIPERYDKASHVSGFHVFACGRFIKFSGSLASLLYGKNGRLVWDAEAVDRGKAALSDALTALFPDGWRLRHLTRVDLVWMFPGAFREWHQAFACASGPEGTGLPHGHPGNLNLTWGKGEFRINLYDKGLLQLRRPGGPARLEVMLRGDKLAKWLGDTWDALTWDNGYRAYKGIVMCFGRRAVPLTRTPWAVIFDLENNGAVKEVCGYSPLEASVRELSAPSRRRRLEEYAAFVSEHLVFDFRELLGESRPKVCAEVSGTAQDDLFPGAGRSPER